MTAPSFRSGTGVYDGCPGLCHNLSNGLPCLHWLVRRCSINVPLRSFRSNAASIELGLVEDAIGQPCSGPVSISKVVPSSVI